MARAWGFHANVSQLASRSRAPVPDHGSAIVVTLPPLPLHPLEMVEQGREKMPLTAGRIVHSVIRHVDGASIELALGWDIRNARRDLLPQRLAITVGCEESCRLPYRWEGVNVLGNGRVRIYCALGIRVWVKCH